MGVLGKNKGRKVRKNRRKRDLGKLRRLWVGRFFAGLKLTGIVIALMAVSAVFMYGYAAVIRSEYFRAERIQVNGNQRVSTERLVSQAGVDIGENLLALNLHKVRKQLLAHPWIAEARVAREIPETLFIQVNEHQPLAQVDLGRLFFINAKGRIFKEVQKEDPKDLPLIKGMTYSDISLGQDELSPLMVSVIRLLEMCQAQGSVIAYRDIEEVRTDREMGVTLLLNGERRLIKLGFDGFKKKLERFGRLRPVLENNRKWRAFHVVDLNNPDRVVVRLGASPREGA